MQIAYWADWVRAASLGLVICGAGSDGTTVEPSGGGASSSVGGLLNLAAENLGRGGHDLSAYEARLEENWITSANELRRMDVKTLSGYMPWGLAHELHAIVHDAEVRDVAPRPTASDDAARKMGRGRLYSYPDSEDVDPRARVLLQPSSDEQLPLFRPALPTRMDNASLSEIIQEAKGGTFHAARLRKDLLNPDVYDRHAFPWEYVWHGMKVGNRTGLPLQFNINFQKVAGVDVVNSVADFVVWFRLVWIDQAIRQSRCR